MSRMKLALTEFSAEWPWIVRIGTPESKFVLRKSTTAQHAFSVVVGVNINGILYWSSRRNIFNLGFLSLNDFVAAGFLVECDFRWHSRPMNVLLFLSVPMISFWVFQMFPHGELKWHSTTWRFELVCDVFENARKGLMCDGRTPVDGDWVAFY